MSIKVDYNKLSNVSLEENVITNIINQNQLGFIFSNISSDYFYNIFYKECFIISRNLFENKHDIDHFRIFDSLSSDFKSESKLEHLLSLFGERITLNDFHINQLENLYKKRKLVDNCEETLLNISEKEYHDIYFDHFTKLENDFNDNQKVEHVTMSDNVDNVITRIEKIANNEIEFDDFGFRNLSSLKMENGHYIIIAARPKVGKTTFLLNAILNWCLKGQRVVFFSLEMTKEQITEKLIKIYGRIKNVYRMDSKEYDRFKDAVHIVKSLDLVIEDVYSNTMNDIKRKIAKHNNIKTVDKVAIDYIQLINGKGNNRHEIVSQISRDIKMTAKNYELPIIALAQLSRAVEDAPNKKPKLHHLKESGSLEQDCDATLLMSLTNQEDKDQNIKSIDFDLAAYRHGNTFLKSLNFESITGAFIDKEN